MGREAGQRKVEGKIGGHPGMVCGLGADVPYNSVGAAPRFISTCYYMEKKMTARVSDLSVDELRVLIQEVVRQTLKDIFRDPDEGLELREDFKSEMQASLNTSQADGNLLSADSVASQLGLEW